MPQHAALIPNDRPKARRPIQLLSDARKQRSAKHEQIRRPRIPSINPYSQCLRTGTRKRQRRMVGPAPWRGLIRPSLEPSQTLCRQNMQLISPPPPRPAAACPASIDKGIDSRISSFHFLTLKNTRQIGNSAKNFSSFVIKCW